MRLPPFFRVRERRLQKRRLQLAKRLMGGKDLRILGHGAFSTAFAIGRHRVFKVTDARDLTAPWFGRYVRRQINPHWPRIFRQARTKCHTLIWMERLYPLNPAARRRAVCADDFLSTCRDTSMIELATYAEIMGLDEPWQHWPVRLGQPLLDCHKEAERLGFLTDSKLDVYMRRPGGILVLADPFLVRA